MIPIEPLPCRALVWFKEGDFSVVARGDYEKRHIVQAFRLKYVIRVGGGPYLAQCKTGFFSHLTRRALGHTLAIFQVPAWRSPCPFAMGTMPETK